MSIPDESPTGLYKIWRAEQRIWSEGLDVLKDLLLDDAIITGPKATDRRRGHEILALPRVPRPFDSVELLDRTYHFHANVAAIDYIALAKHPRFRRPYTAQCHSVWVKSLETSIGWKMMSHVHRALPAKLFRELTGQPPNIGDTD